MKDTHYNNENGSIYKFCLEQDLNPYEFDLIKRIVRCRRKGQWLEDLEKTKVAIDLYIKEQRMAFEHPNLMKVKDAMEKLKRRLNIDTKTSKSKGRFYTGGFTGEIKRRLNIDTELKEMEEEFGNRMYVPELIDILKSTQFSAKEFIDKYSIRIEFIGKEAYMDRSNVYDALKKSTNITREDAYGDNHYRCDNDRC